MMKKFTFCMMLCSILASCFNDENDVVEECYNQEQPTITFEGFKFSDDTRASIGLDGNGFYADFYYGFMQDRATLKRISGLYEADYDIYIKGRTGENNSVHGYLSDSIDSGQYIFYTPAAMSKNGIVQIPVKFDSLQQTERYPLMHLSSCNVTHSGVFSMRKCKDFETVLKPLWSILCINLVCQKADKWTRVEIESATGENNIVTSFVYDPYMNRYNGGFCNIKKSKKLTLRTQFNKATNNFTAYIPVLPSKTGLLNVRAVDSDGLTYIFTNVPSVNINAGECFNYRVSQITSIRDTIHPYVVINDAVWAKYNVGANNLHEKGKGVDMKKRFQNIVEDWGNEWELPSENDWRNLLWRTTIERINWGPEYSVRVRDRYNAVIQLPLNSGSYADYWTSNGYVGNSQYNSSEAYAVAFPEQCKYGDDVDLVTSKIFLNSILYRRLIHKRIE